MTTCCVLEKPDKLKLLLVSIVILSLFSCLLNQFSTNNYSSFNTLSCQMKDTLTCLKYIITSMFFISLFYSIFYSIYKKTAREKDKFEECKKLKKEESERLKKVTSPN